VHRRRSDLAALNDAARPSRRQHELELRAIFRAAGLLLSRVDPAHASLTAEQILPVGRGVPARPGPPAIRSTGAGDEAAYRETATAAVHPATTAAADDDDDDDAYIITLSHRSALPRRILRTSSESGFVWSTPSNLTERDPAGVHGHRRAQISTRQRLTLTVDQLQNRQRILCINPIRCL